MIKSSYPDSINKQKEPRNMNPRRSQNDNNEMKQNKARQDGVPTEENKREKERENEQEMNKVNKEKLG